MTLLMNQRAVVLRMILSDLPSPAEAGFAKAGNRFPSPIEVEDMLFRIMRVWQAGRTR
jgi:hypothetical protein